MSEMEIDTTPDDMELELDEEYDCDWDSNAACCGDSDDCTTVSVYSDPFEHIGDILRLMENSSLNGDDETRPLDDPNTLEIFLADVGASTSDGMAPLLAGAAQREEVMPVLLKCKADQNGNRFNGGESPLHAAIRHRHIAVINQLLNTADINEANSLGQTPLMLAIFHEMNDVAIRLIDMGAELNLVDHYEHTALFLAVTQNNIDLSTYLMTRGAHSTIYHCLLNHCAKRNYLRMAGALIEHGQDLNICDMFGNTPFLLAIMFKRVEMLEYLLKSAAVQRLQGKNIHHVEDGLLTAVQYAFSGKQFTRIARLLLVYDEACLNGDAQYDESRMSCSCCYNPYGRTPLSRAITLYKMDVAEVLVKEGADVAQICQEHVVHTLRLALQKDFVALAILLVHAGFKFPALPLDRAFKSNWLSHRIELETTMRELTWTPLSLQSLARIKIRQHVNTSGSKRLKATKQQSALSQAISLLGVPKPLQIFLNDFGDLPRVAISYE